MQSPRFGFEQNPPHQESVGQSSPEIPDVSPERAGEFTQQRQAAHVETESLPPILPTAPDPIFSTPQVDDQTKVNDDIPQVANDDDLIEKEWVDKAKKIIASTKDDPYRREKEVSQLQIEYIRKRYGREIGNVAE